jgi:hypothetical protein
MGWFPTLFAALVGGPSVLELVQYAFPHFQLTPYLQWIVDGWRQLMAVLGAVIEPPVELLLSWLNDWLDWGLVLDPVWRSLFALSMVLLMAVVRHSWRSHFNTWRSLLVLALFFLFLVFWALAAGIYFGSPEVANRESGVFTILAMAGVVLLNGIVGVWYGLATGRAHFARMGLTALGGFITAGVIMAADFLMKALGGA